MHAKYENTSCFSMNPNVTFYPTVSKDAYCISRMYLPFLAVSCYVFRYHQPHCAPENLHVGQAGTLVKRFV